MSYSLITYFLFQRKIKNKENRNFRAAVAGANGNDNAGQVIVNKHDVEEVCSIETIICLNCYINMIKAHMYM